MRVYAAVMYRRIPLNEVGRSGRRMDPLGLEVRTARSASSVETENTAAPTRLGGQAEVDELARAMTQ
jgi:hypothetical protein